MPFALLDDRFHDNPKIAAAGNAAAGVYARALSYCSDKLTDGWIPDAWVKKESRPNERRKITETRLWNHVNGGETFTITQRANRWPDITITAPGPGYYIPDYLKLNPSKTDVSTRRAAKSAAGTKGAQSRWSHNISHNNGIAPAIDLPQQEDDSARTRPPPRTPSKSEPLSTPARENDLEEQARQTAWEQRAALPDVRSKTAFVLAGMRNGGWPDAPRDEPGRVNMPASDRAGVVAGMIRNGAISDRVELEGELGDVDEDARDSLRAQFGLMEQLRESAALAGSTSVEGGET